MISSIDICLNSLFRFCLEHQIKLTFGLLQETDGSPVTGAFSSKAKEISLHSKLKENKVNLAFVLAHEISHFILWQKRENATSKKGFKDFSSLYKKLSAANGDKGLFNDISFKDFETLRLSLKSFEKNLIEEEIACNKYAYCYLKEYDLITSANKNDYSINQTSAELRPHYELKSEKAFIDQCEMMYLKQTVRKKV